MEHGRDHEERQQKSRPPRTNNTPKGDAELELEQEVSSVNRHGVVPPQGVIGAHLERPGYSEEVPRGAGSDTAPTERALELERERHRREMPR